MDAYISYVGFTLVLVEATTYLSEASLSAAKPSGRRKLPYGAIIPSLNHNYPITQIGNVPL